MKILGFSLLILAAGHCEFPPPWSGSSRPNQPFQLPASGNIQRVYGPPKQQYPVPQPHYGSPNINNVRPSRPGHQLNSLQTTYGAPSKQQNGNYQPSGNNANQNWPQVHLEPQVVYGLPENTRRPPNQPLQRPQNQSPRHFGNNIWQNQPQPGQNNQYQHVANGRDIRTQYGVPDQRGIESFDRFQQQRNQNQRQPWLPTEQYLPLRNAVDFRNSAVPTIEFSQQYLPIKEATSFRNPQSKNFGGVQNDIDLPVQNQNFPTQTVTPPSIDIRQVEVKPVGENGVDSRNYQPVSDGYLPSTTPRILITERPIPSSTTGRPIEGTVKPTEPTVEESTSSEPEETNSDNPNVAIATAVSGRPVGQTFYLVQPDGRFQRVVYQKTQEQGDQENEYTANYNFQNIRADPNLVYTPLITLG